VQAQAKAKKSELFMTNLDRTEGLTELTHSFLRVVEGDCASQTNQARTDRSESEEGSANRALQSVRIAIDPRDDKYSGFNPRRRMDRLVGQFVQTAERTRTARKAAASIDEKKEKVTSGECQRSDDNSGQIDKPEEIKLDQPIT